MAITGCIRILKKGYIFSGIFLPILIKSQKCFNISS